MTAMVFREPYASTAAYRSEVLRYFAAKAASYDLVEEQVYWRLSDQLLQDLIDQALPDAEDPVAVLDAGGGTGRWTEYILKSWPAAQVTLYDLSEDMLGEARTKFAQNPGCSGRITIRHGDLLDIDHLLPGAGFDVIICLHNVAGFVPGFDQCFAILANRLPPGGVFVLVAPNKYHVAWFNILRRDFAMAEEALRTSRGRFTVDMPMMRLFSPRDLAALATENDLEIQRLGGFPVLCYPDFQETRISGNSADVARRLGSKSDFDAVLSLERAALAEPDLAGRGNNLVLIARRPAVDSSRQGPQRSRAPVVAHVAPEIPVDVAHRADLGAVVGVVKQEGDGPLTDRPGLVPRHGD